MILLILSIIFLYYNKFDLLIKQNQNENEKNIYYIATQRSIY